MQKRELLLFARQMRKEPTPSEDAFWQAVRGRKACGVKFRRQQIIGPFVVDFFAPSHRLVVEIDGGVHFGREEHDAAREQFLQDCGLRVLRFDAVEVEQSLERVLETVAGVLGAPLSTCWRGVGGEAASRGRR
jgi:very-short-patch-repair endonuclease